MLLRQGLTPAWVGMVAGVFLSVVTARLMVTVVETTATLRPVIMLVIVPVLVAVTLLAAFVPARRAAKTAPTVAPRCARSRTLAASLSLAPRNACTS
jgi:ABC-type antimicrobial peptide transport system permease subunit